MSTHWVPHALTSRWAGQPSHVVLHLGPHSVAALLDVWAVWQADAARCDRLHLIAVAAEPPGDGSLPSRRLRCAWPVAAPGWHAIGLEGGRVQWLLDLAQPPGAWTQLVAQADTVLGTPASDDARRGWTPASARALSRLAAAHAQLHLDACDDPQDDTRRRAALRSAGFVPENAVAPNGAPHHGSGDQPGMAGLPCTLHHRPPRPPRRPPTRGIAARTNHADRILIIGGGLAGCAVAEALAELGRASTVIDRHPQVAGDASGNPAGLFHGIVTPDDGLHARYNRAAALATQRSVARAIAEHGVAGSTGGLLRLQLPTSRMHDIAGRSTLAAMRATLARLRLPADYVQALDAESASARAGLRIEVPAWWYPGGGWVDPAALARAMLRRAGRLVTWQGGVHVAALRRDGAGWQLCDAAGHTIDAAPTVVLANAADAHRLLGHPDWPLQRLRGQLSSMSANVLADLQPAVPLAGAGYVLPRFNGQLWFGATSQPDDADAAVRTADHVVNLGRLSSLTGWRTEAVAPACLSGRTAWRWSAEDRLPLVGAVPIRIEAGTSSGSADQTRHVPRVPGLYLHTALGGRGITWSTLGGRLLAALLAGAPLPLASDVVDAVDPARYTARAARRAHRLPSPEPGNDIPD